MEKYSQLLVKSYFLAKKSPLWWFLVFLQIFGLGFVIIFFKPWYFNGWLVVPLVFMFGLFNVSSIWLWLDIAAKNENKAKVMLPKYFSKLCLDGMVISGFALLLLFLIRLVYRHWATLTLLSSLVASSVLFAMLFVVICHQPVFKALRQTLDFWLKRTSLAAITSLVLMLGHGLSYFFAHTIWLSIRYSNEFSVLPGSATIWILLVILVLFFLALSVILNIFLVLFFLEVINRQKIAAEEPARQPAVAPLGNT